MSCLRIASLLAAWIALSLLTATGCGPGEMKTVPVEGTVTLGKTPLKTGSITFHPEGGGETTGSSLPVGTIENGAYKLGTGEKPGAPPGRYKVTITATVPSDPKDEYSEPRSLIAEKFGDPSTTTLSADVKEGGGPYNFEVTK